MPYVRFSAVLKRTVRPLVAAAFAASNAFFPHAAEANFWTDRKAAAREARRGGSFPAEGSSSQLLASLPQARQAGLSLAPAATVGGGLDGAGEGGALSPSARREGPENERLRAVMAAVLPHGTVREVLLSKNPGAPLIVHIQDAHGVLEAQRNIAAMVEALAGAAPLVALEGAAGPFELEEYRAWPDRALTRDVADFFLRQGHITGPEFAGLSAERPPLLWGVEDLDLYKENVRAFLDARALKPALARRLEALRSRAAELKETAFSPELKAFDKKVSAFHAHALAFAEYVEHLAAAAPAAGSFPNFDLLCRAFRLEKSLDFNEVERERRRLIERLSGALDKAALEDLVRRSLDLRAGRTAYGAYHEHLRALCRGAGIRLEEYGPLNAYLDYVVLAERIDRSRLLEELSRRERAVGDVLARTPEQQALLSVVRRLTLLEKLSVHAMTPEDWAAYEADRAGVLGLPAFLEGGAAEGLEDLLAPFESFCRTAVGRNGALAGNLAAKLAGGPAAVLVAGGFHTQGLTENLRAKGFSYVVVTPNISEIPKDQDYLDVFVRQTLPLEQLFTGDTVHMVYAEATAASTPGLGARFAAVAAEVRALLSALLEFVHHGGREAVKIKGSDKEILPGGSQAIRDIHWRIGKTRGVMAAARRLGEGWARGRAWLAAHRRWEGDVLVASFAGQAAFLLFLGPTWWLLSPPALFVLAHFGTMRGRYRTLRGFYGPGPALRRWLVQWGALAFGTPLLQVLHVFGGPARRLHGRFDDWVRADRPVSFMGRALHPARWLPLFSIIEMPDLGSEPFAPAMRERHPGDTLDLEGETYTLVGSKSPRVYELRDAGGKSWYLRDGSDNGDLGRRLAAKRAGSALLREHLPEIRAGSDHLLASHVGQTDLFAVLSDLDQSQLLEVGRQAVAFMDELARPDHGGPVYFFDIVGQGQLRLTLEDGRPRLFLADVGVEGQDMNENYMEDALDQLLLALLRRIHPEVLDQAPQGRLERLRRYFTTPAPVFADEAPRDAGFYPHMVWELGRWVALEPKGPWGKLGAELLQVDERMSLPEAARLFHHYMTKKHRPPEFVGRSPLDLNMGELLDIYRNAVSAQYMAIVHMGMLGEPTPERLQKLRSLWPTAPAFQKVSVALAGPDREILAKEWEVLEAERLAKAPPAGPVRPGFVFEWLFDVFGINRQKGFGKWLHFGLAAVLGPRMETSALAVLSADPTGIAAMWMGIALLALAVLSAFTGLRTGRIKTREEFRAALWGPVFSVGAAALLAALAATGWAWLPGAKVMTALIFAAAHPDAWVDLLREKGDPRRIGRWTFAGAFLWRAAGGWWFTDLLQSSSFNDSWAAHGLVNAALLRLLPGHRVLRPFHTEEAPAPFEEGQRVSGPDGEGAVKAVELDPRLGWKVKVDLDDGRELSYLGPSVGRLSALSGASPTEKLAREIKTEWLVEGFGKDFALKNRELLLTIGARAGSSAKAVLTVRLPSLRNRLGRSEVEGVLPFLAAVLTEANESDLFKRMTALANAVPARGKTSEALFEHTFPALDAVATTENYPAILDDLRRLTQSAGKRAGPLFREALPAVLGTLKDSPAGGRFWDVLAKIGLAAGGNADGAVGPLASLVEAFGGKWVEGKAGSLETLGIASEQAAGRLYSGILALKDGFGATWVDSHWDALAIVAEKMPRAAGPLFEGTLPVLKSFIEEKGLEAVLDDLSSIERASPGNAIGLFSLRLPAVVEYWESSQMSDRWDDLVSGLRRAGPGSAGFLKGLEAHPDFWVADGRKARLGRWADVCRGLGSDAEAFLKLEAGDYFKRRFSSEDRFELMEKLAALFKGLPSACRNAQFLNALAQAADSMAEGEGSLEPSRLIPLMEPFLRAEYVNSTGLEFVNSTEDPAELIKALSPVLTLDNHQDVLKAMDDNVAGLPLVAKMAEVEGMLTRENYKDRMSQARRLALAVAGPQALETISGQLETATMRWGAGWVREHWGEVTDLGEKAGKDAIFLLNALFMTVPSHFGYERVNLQWNDRDWEALRKSVSAILWAASDYNRKGLLELAFDVTFLSRVSHRRHFEDHLAFFAEVVTAEPRIGLQVMQEVQEWLAAGEGAIRPLPPHEWRKVLDFVRDFRGFAPELYKVYRLHGGPESADLRAVREFAEAAVRDEVGKKEVEAFLSRYEKRGLDAPRILLAAVQSVIPSSGASFVGKKEVLGLLQRFIESGDRRRDVPKPLRDRKFGGGPDWTIPMSGWKAKPGVALDPEGEAAALAQGLRLGEPAAREDADARRAADGKAAREAIHGFLAAGAPTEGQKKVLEAFLAHVRHDDRLGEKVDRIRTDDHYGLSLLEQLFGDQDELPGVLENMVGEVLAASPELNPEKVFDALRDPAALARQLVAMWNAPGDESSRRARVLKRLERISPADVNGQLLPLLAVEPGLQGAVEAWATAPRMTLTVRDAADAVLSAPRQLIKEERAKFEQTSLSEDISLSFRVVKGIPYGLWGLCAGVCVATDLKMWEDRKFTLMAIIDESTGRVVGFAHLYEVKDGKKKRLLVPGINPSVEFLSTAPAAPVYELIERALIQVAEEGDYDSLDIPTDPGIYSNRTDVQALIRTKHEKTMVTLRKTVHWNNIPIRYPVNQVFRIWEKGRGLSPETLTTRRTRRAAVRFFKYLGWRVTERKIAVFAGIVEVFQFVFATPWFAMAHPTKFQRRWIGVIAAASWALPLLLFLAIGGIPTPELALSFGLKVAAWALPTNILLHVPANLLILRGWNRRRALDRAKAEKDDRQALVAALKSLDEKKVKNDLVKFLRAAKKSVEKRAGEAATPEKQKASLEALLSVLSEKVLEDVLDGVPAPPRTPIPPETRERLRAQVQAQVRHKYETLLRQVARFAIEFSDHTQKGLREVLEDMAYHGLPAEDEEFFADMLKHDPNDLAKKLVRSAAAQFLLERMAPPTLTLTGTGSGKVELPAAWTEAAAALKFDELCRDFAAKHPGLTEALARRLIHQTSDLDILREVVRRLGARKAPSLKGFSRVVETVAMEGVLAPSVQSDEFFRLYHRGRRTLGRIPMGDLLRLLKLEPEEYRALGEALSSRAPADRRSMAADLGELAENLALLSRWDIGYRLRARDRVALHRGISDPEEAKGLEKGRAALIARGTFFSFSRDYAESFATEGDVVLTAGVDQDSILSTHWVTRAPAPEILLAGRIHVEDLQPGPPSEAEARFQSVTVGTWNDRYFREEVNGLVGRIKEGARLVLIEGNPTAGKSRLLRYLRDGNLQVGLPTGIPFVQGAPLFDLFEDIQRGTPRDQVRRHTQPLIQPLTEEDWDALVSYVRGHTFEQFAAEFLRLRMIRGGHTHAVYLNDVAAGVVQHEFVERGLAKRSQIVTVTVKGKDNEVRRLALSPVEPDEDLIAVGQYKSKYFRGEVEELARRVREGARLVVIEGRARAGKSELFHRLEDGSLTVGLPPGIPFVQGSHVYDAVEETWRGGNLKDIRVRWPVVNGVTDEEWKDLTRTRLIPHDEQVARFLKMWMARTGHTHAVYLSDVATRIVQVTFLREGIVDRAGLLTVEIRGEGNQARRLSFDPAQSGPRLEYEARPGAPGRLSVDGKEAVLVGPGSNTGVYRHPGDSSKAVRVNYLPPVKGAEEDPQHRVFRELGEEGISPKMYASGVLPEGHPYAVVDFVEGETVLAMVIKGSLTQEDLDSLLDLVDALADRGVLFRDFSLKQIMIGTINGGPRRVYLVDGEPDLAVPENIDLRKFYTAQLVSMIKKFSPPGSGGANILEGRMEEAGFHRRPLVVRLLALVGVGFGETWVFRVAGLAGLPALFELLGLPSQAGLLLGLLWSGPAFYRLFHRKSQRTAALAGATVLFNAVFLLLYNLAGLDLGLAASAVALIHGGWDIYRHIRRRAAARSGMETFAATGEAEALLPLMRIGDPRGRAPLAPARGRTEELAPEFQAVLGAAAWAAGLLGMDAAGLWRGALIKAFKMGKLFPSDLQAGAYKLVDVSDWDDESRAVYLSALEVRSGGAKGIVLGSRWSTPALAAAGVLFADVPPGERLKVGPAARVVQEAGGLSLEAMTSRKELDQEGVPEGFPPVTRSPFNLSSAIREALKAVALILSQA